MGLLSPAPALINQALLLAVVGNWSISAAASPPPPNCHHHHSHLPPSPFNQARGYNASLPLTSDQRRGHGGESGSQSWAHPLQLLFLSVAAGRRDSIKSSVYSALRLHQGPLSEHTSPPTPEPSPKPYTHPRGLIAPPLPPAQHSAVVLPLPVLPPFFFLPSSNVVVGFFSAARITIIIERRTERKNKTERQDEKLGEEWEQTL